MFTRSILIPSLIVCAISAPFLLSPNNFSNNPVATTDSSPENWTSNSVYPAAGTFLGQPSPTSTLPGSNTFLPGNNAEFAGFPNRKLPVRAQNSSSNFYQPTNPPARLVPFGLVSRPTELSSLPNTIPAQNVGIPQNVGPPVGVPPGSEGMGQIGPPTNIGRLTPDLMSAQTYIFPGNEFGPDLNAQPLEFLPVTDFGEIFRFDISPNWVKSRWKRISTNPGEDDLHGLRVALVTGVNSWDLHGSLTYYFDASQQCQRITFRGWTGDPARLLNLLTQRYGFKAQQTHLAGYYLAQKFWKSTGGLLMKHPPVIYSENPGQQLAIVMEINNPTGQTRLSDDFQSLIDGSQTR